MKRTKSQADLVDPPVQEWYSRYKKCEDRACAQPCRWVVEGAEDEKGNWYCDDCWKRWKAYMEESEAPASSSTQPQGSKTTATGKKEDTVIDAMEVDG